MLRKLKSPLLAEHIKDEVYRLYFKTWQISEDEVYHSPSEDVLGMYVKTSPRERCDEKITTYDPVSGPKTHYYKKMN